MAALHSSSVSSSSAAHTESMRLHLFTLLSLSLSAFASMDAQIPLPGTLAPARQPTLADLLTLETSASIFFAYARETALSARFADPAARSAVLVPTNAAVVALPRKPHQSPVEPDIEISEQEYDEQSKLNVENWVSAHIIPRAPIDISKSTYQTLLENRTVSFSVKDKESGKPQWSQVAVDGHIRILSMKEASNGVLYVIDGTITVD